MWLFLMGHLWSPRCGYCILEEATSILLQTMCQKKKVQLIEIYIIIYLNVNRVLIIHFENILKIYLKYVRNMPLFHSILKIILLLQVLLQIYKEWHPQNCIHNNMPFYKATPTCRCIWKPLGFIQGPLNVTLIQNCNTNHVFL